jgi:hypothetical protein
MKLTSTQNLRTPSGVGGRTCPVRKRQSVRMDCFDQDTPCTFPTPWINEGAFLKRSI